MLISKIHWLNYRRTKTSKSKSVVFLLLSSVFLLEANPVQFNTFPVCARGPTRGAVACALINTQRRSLVELRWRHVGEEAGI